MFHLTQIVVLRVCGPPAPVAALPPWPTASGVVLASGRRPGLRGAAPLVEVCGRGPCFGRCTPCGLGSGWCLWFGSWFGRCSQCVVLVFAPVPCPAVAVLSALRLRLARGARLCRPSRGSGRCAYWSLRGGSSRCALYTVCVGLAVYASGARPRPLSLGLLWSLVSRRGM